MRTLFCVIFSTIVLAGCGKPEQLSEASFILKQPVPASQYKSTLALHKNGTYKQVVEDKSGTIYSREGKWKQERRTITFDRFLCLVELDKDMWSEKPIEVFGENAILEENYLVFREMSGFIYVRETKWDEKK